MDEEEQKLTIRESVGALLMLVSLALIVVGIGWSAGIWAFGWDSGPTPAALLVLAAPFMIVGWPMARGD
jgi:hypothetical protein